MTNDVSLRIGSYEVLGTIAKSSAATVLKARHEVTGRIVALKLAGPRFRTRPEFAQRFLADARLAAGLIHPNITRVHDSGLHGEDPFVALELVEGNSLDTLLKSRRLSVPEVLKVVKAVARGLGYAHSQGVFHTNLKPRNVLLTEDFRTIQLTDFGGGRLESAKVETGTLATGQMSVGTVHYAAPEVAHGSSPADARSDLYSLGVIFYEMLTGRAPSGRINLPSQLVAGLTPTLDPIVIKCLAQDRNKRYTSAEDLLAELTHLEQEQQLQLAAELEGIERTTRRLLGSQPGQAAGSGKGGLLLIGGAALALVVLGLVAWFVLGNKQSAPPEPANPAPQASAPSEPAGSQPVEPKPAPESASPSVPSPVAQTPPQQPPPKPAKNPATPSTTSAKPAPAASTTSATTPAPAATASTEAAATPSSSAQEQLAEAQRQANAGNAEEARKLYGEVASKNPGKPEALTALLAKAAIEEKQGKYRLDDKYGGSVPAALVTYRALTESFPTARQAETAFWKLGEMYEKAKKYELAAQAFSELGTRFPQTQLEAWYRAGQLYDKELKDAARARQAYSKVPAGSARYKDAQARLKKL